MKRRSFIQVIGTAAGGYAVTRGGAVLAETAPAAPLERVSGMPRRILGRTGQKVSIVGFSGLALVQQGQEEGTAALHRAFDRGVNYYDVAPAYGDGDAEKKMGVGLRGLDRQKLFLACKTKMRDAKGAREELDRSLQRLQTDHFDLYQLHHVVSPDQVRQILGPGGAMETLLQARAEGKVKYFGFSAHTTKGALELMKGFRFDAVMFPINFVEYLTRGFGKEVLELAQEQGAAVVAIKPMCRGAWAEGARHTREWWYQPVEDPKEIDLVLRFTLSLRGVVTGFAPAFLDLVDRAIDLGHNYRDLTLAELNEVVRIAWSCRSIFQREESQVAGAANHPGIPYSRAAGEFV